MKALRKLIGTTALLVAATAAGYLYFRRQPAFAVLEAAYALKACDRPRFERAVDVASVAGGVADELLAAPEKGEGFGVAMILGLGAMMKPVIGTMAAKAVGAFVAQCKLFETLEGPVGGLAPVAKALNETLGAETAALHAWMNTERRADKLAVIRVPTKSGIVGIELQMDGEAWRVTKVPGALALIKK